MELSCHTNRLNDQHATFLMPGEELHDTPQGDVTQDHTKVHGRSCDDDIAIF